MISPSPSVIYKALFGFGLCFFAITTLLHAEELSEYETLYKKIFKVSPTKQLLVVTSEVVIDGSKKPDSKIRLSSLGDSFELLKESLLILLQDHIEKEGLTAISQLPEKDKWINLDTLKTLNFTYQFRKKTNQLFINTPATYRKQVVVSLSTIQNQPIQGTLPPSDGSGYLNILASQTYLHQDPLFLPINLQLNHAVFAGGWSLKSGVDILGGHEHPIAVKTSYLSYQDVSNRIIYAGGTLPYPVIGFQPNIPLVGVGFSRSYLANPDQIPPFKTSHRMLLKHDATVSIRRNGHLIGWHQLPKGWVELQNFPLILGKNDITISVLDPDTKASENMALSFVYDPSLLSTHTSEFSLATGLAYTAENRTLIIQNEPVITSFFREGINQDCQLGGYATVKKDQALLGIENVFSNAFGKFQISVAGLKTPSDMGYGAYLVFTPYSSIFSGARLMYQDKVFGSSQTEIDAGKISLSQSQTLYLWHQPYLLTTSYLFDSNTGSSGYGSSAETSYLLSDKSKLTLQSFYRHTATFSPYGLQALLNADICGCQTIFFSKWNRLSDTTPDTVVVGFSLYMALTVGDHHLTARTSQSGTGESTTGLDDTLSTKGSSYTATHLDVTRDSIRLAGEWNQQDTMSQFLGRANVLFGTSQSEQNQNILFSGPRGRIVLNSDETKTWTSDHSHTNRTSSLTLETSIVYAGGHWAISKPINGDNGFVLAYPHPSLRGKRILVSHQAQIDDWGPAVIEIRPYRASHIDVGRAYLGKGYELEKRKFDIYLPQNSGVAIQIGSSQTWTIKAHLIQKDSHKPYGFKVFKLQSLSNPEWKPRWILSNTDGMIVEKGLDQGRYQLESKNTDPIEWVVSENHPMLLNLGQLDISLKESAQ